MSVLEAFRKESETICHLQNAGRLLGWDQQIMMCKSSSMVEVRGRQQAALSGLAHQRITCSAFGDLLERTADILGDDTSSVDAHSLARWQRDRKRACSVSAELVESLSLTGAESFEAWRQAKAANNFSQFEPYLTKMFDLNRQ